MGSRFHQLSLIETSVSGAYFRKVTRAFVAEGVGLHEWMLRELAAHECDLGLYVGETGLVVADEDQVDDDLWLAWDGAAAFSTSE